MTVPVAHGRLGAGVGPQHLQAGRLLTRGGLRGVVGARRAGRQHASRRCVRVALRLAWAAVVGTSWCRLAFRGGIGLAGAGAGEGRARVRS